ncbi:MAG: TIGR01459 family HAD-type hydrolase [Candidatus Cardinium sp.]|nr:TIGR01459 family HAD-type hydrolase [Candidatus Cardinium sp.]
MIPLICKHIREVLDDYDIFLFDIWGVIIEADQPCVRVVHTIATMIEQKRKVFFVTNAPRTAAFLQATLQSWGIPATEEMIISSGSVALGMLQNSAAEWGIPAPLVYHLGRASNNLIHDQTVAITHDIHAANLVLLTFFCEETEKEMLETVERTLAVIGQRNILTLCANPDLGLMRESTYRYCAGYFAEKIKQLGGKVVYAGKPYPKIFYKLLDQQPAVAKNRILMIGDTFDTDILGAHRVGIDSALVLTGNARKYYDPLSPLEQQLQQLTIAAMEKKRFPNFCIQLA